MGLFQIIVNHPSVHSMIKKYLQEMFEPTVNFGFFGTLAGVTAAFYFGQGQANVLLGMLACLGVVFAQGAVNLIDDYCDFKSGLDQEAEKTPFSGGGSKVLRPNTVLLLGTSMLIVALLIGAYILSVTGGPVLALMVFGALAVVLYAKYLTYIPFAAETVCAASFILAGVGGFYVSATHLVFSLYLLPAALVFIAAGIQGGVVLTVNEIPDREIDRKFGRKSGIVLLGTNQGAASIYAAFYLVAYGAIICGVAFAGLPIWFLLILVMLLPNYRILKGILAYTSPKKFIDTMALDVFTTLGFMALLCLLFAI